MKVSKKLLTIGGIMIIMAMMIVAVVSETAALSSAMQSYIQAENGERSIVTSTTIAVNNTQTATMLYNYQYVTVSNLPGYAWNYYYIDLSANQYVSITHNTLGSAASFEILMNHYDRPTIYSYSKRVAMSSYQSTLSSDSKSYYHRLYIAVRNNAHTVYGYNLNVRTYTTTPTPTPNPTTTVVYRTNSGLTLGLGVPALVVSVILLIVVLSQIKKIKALTSRIEQLEKRLQYNMPPLDQEMPVLMNVPLMAANSLQQDHEEIQQQPIPQTQPTLQPPTTNPVPEQQPTTLPHFFPQFVQQQQLPPQFKNAQPYPFMYPPQVVFSQPPQQVQPQQPTGQTQSKQ